ncbi:hypothetical protein CI109_102985 [Kwoniella shandongensis]|uniref:HMG box domain-containing protein n=1 Tax=Kwoniella shandongensis TaxID=1734106 RepID=A0AAJ8LIR8_9TREE
MPPKKIGICISTLSSRETNQPPYVDPGASKSSKADVTSPSLPSLLLYFSCSSLLPSSHSCLLTSLAHPHPAATDSKATGKKKGTGKPSAYNEYMKVQLAKLKADNEKSGKTNDHKDNFKKVAESWKTAPENPKNKK